MSLVPFSHFLSPKWNSCPLFGFFLPFFSVWGEQKKISGDKKTFFKKNWVYFYFGRFFRLGDKKVFLNRKIFFYILVRKKLIHFWTICWNSFLWETDKLNYWKTHYISSLWSTRNILNHTIYFVCFSSKIIQKWINFCHCHNINKYSFVLRD